MFIIFQMDEWTVDLDNSSPERNIDVEDDASIDRIDLDNFESQESS